MQHSTHTPTPPRETVEVWNRCHGGHSGGETPGHIPNPEAKPSSADGTAPASVWESRTPPDNNVTVEGRPPGAALNCVCISGTAPRREGCTCERSSAGRRPPRQEPGRLRLWRLPPGRIRRPA